MASSMEAVVGLLERSLNHTQAKAAETELKQFDKQPGFSLTLLHIVNADQLPLSTRLAGALYFKNLVRKYWTDENRNYLLPNDDVLAIKTEIISLMISLPANLQAQLGEAVAAIADSDFPDRWMDLIPNLTHRLGDDAKINNGVLTVAHSIFERWRPLFRSDDLFREIGFVLEQFTDPYYACMQHTHKMIQENAQNKVALTEWLSTMSLLIKIFYDLNCQDIPAFFEDHIDQFMELLHYYLLYSNKLVETDDDSEFGLLEETKSDICEILQLYTQRYEEEFAKALPTFVDSAWNLLTSIGPEPKYDLLVNRALAFLTSVARLQRYNSMFESDQVLTQIIEKIIVPNMTMRESDEELFEDDPMEFIRRDLEGSDSDTRRRAATDFLRELATKMEGKVTQLVMKYVDEFLKQYLANPAANWRMKNTSSYLFSSIAAKGNFTAAGVSTTSLMIDVVGYFSKSIAPDLVAAKVHPILQVDAIRFIHNFRNQLTKEQLTQALPLLVQLLSSDNFVVYTYAAITIERILSIRQDNVNMFLPEDIQSEAGGLINSLMSLILRHSATPEKLSENEFLMKGIMRVLITVQSRSQVFAASLLPQLMQILLVVSQNASNPKFTHYLFESIGAVIKYAGTHIGTEKLEEMVLGPCLQILGQDVTELIPYALQILSQVLLIQPGGTLPPAFQQLMRPLMTPLLWEPKGNVPALVSLVQAILSHGGPAFVKEGLLKPLLGVFQNLISSRANDSYGLDLLEYIFLYVPHDQIASYSKDIAQLLLTRLQQSRTTRFVTRFSLLIYFLSATSTNGLGPEFAIGFIDHVQPGLFGQVLDSFILPTTLKIHGSFSRRIAAIGLTNLLCQTQVFTTGQYSAKWSSSVEVLFKLMETNLAEEHDDKAATSVDTEDVSFGSSFSRLSTAAFKPLDPVPQITKPEQYFESEIKRLSETFGPAVEQLVAFTAHKNSQRIHS